MKPMRIRKGLILASMVFLMAGAHPASVMASGYQLGYNTNASDNDYISTTKAPRGRVGKSMSISFRVRATDEDMDNLKRPMTSSRLRRGATGIIRLTTILLKSWKPRSWPRTWAI